MTIHELKPPFEQHLYPFKILNSDDAMPERVITSPLSQDGMSRLDAEGYVLLRQFLQPAPIRAFQSIVDEVRSEVYADSAKDTYRSGRFGGQYLRDLHARRWDAWALLLDSGIPDLVRSVLGPRILLRSYSARVTFPDSSSSTEWHCDQRARVSPPPPWFTDAHSATVLVYLDIANEASGCTDIVQGSHKFMRLPDLQSVEAHASLHHRVEAMPGDVLLFHGALWHRASPTNACRHTRRVLNLQFAPSWSKRAYFEQEPPSPAWLRAVEAAKEGKRADILELLGFGGYM